MKKTILYIFLASYSFGFIATPQNTVSTSGNLSDIKIYGDRIFLAEGSGGFKVINKNTLATMHSNATDVGSVSSIDYNGTHIFTIDVITGLKIFSIDSDDNITMSITKIPHMFSQSPIALAVNKDKLYLSSMDTGAKVYSLDSLPNISQIGDFDAPNANRIVIKNGITFVGAGANGLKIYNTNEQNSTNPSFLGSVSTSGSVINLKSQDNYLYVANYNNVQIYNISNISSPSLLHTIESDGISSGVEISADGNTLFVASGNSGYKIFDVTNKSAPILKAHSQTNNNTKDLKVVDGELFVIDGSGGMAKYNYSSVITEYEQSLAVVDPGTTEETDEGDTTTTVEETPQETEENTIEEEINAEDEVTEEQPTAEEIETSEDEISTTIKIEENSIKIETTQNDENSNQATTTTQISIDDSTLVTQNEETITLSNSIENDNITIESNVQIDKEDGTTLLTNTSTDKESGETLETNIDMSEASDIDISIKQEGLSADIDSENNTLEVNTNNLEEKLSITKKDKTDDKKSTILPPVGSDIVLKNDKAISTTQIKNQEGETSKNVVMKLDTKNSSANGVYISNPNSNQALLAKAPEGVGDSEQYLTTIEDEISTDKILNKRFLFKKNFNAISTKFKSNRNFIIFDRRNSNTFIANRSENNPSKIEIMPTLDSEFKDILVFEGDRYFILTSGDANISQDGKVRKIGLGEAISIPAITSKAPNTPIYINKKLKIEKGWNLISLPAKNFDDFDDFKDMQIYTFLNNKWITGVENIKSSRGFWVNSNEQKRVSIQGSKYSIDSKSTITEGWNLLGAGRDINNLSELGKTWLFVNGAWLDDEEDIYRGQGFWLHAKNSVYENGILKLSKGWNLLASPIGTGFLSSIITKNEVIFEYNYDYSRWEKNPIFIKPKVGYWVKQKDSEKIELSGDGYTNDILIDGRWKLLGSGKTVYFNSTDHNQTRQYFTWDGKEWKFNPSKIERGQGYWIIDK